MATVQPAQWTKLADVNWEVDNNEFLTINYDGSWSVTDQAAIALRHPVHSSPNLWLELDWIHAVQSLSGAGYSYIAERLGR